jgi:hypothetical protein
VFSYINHLKTEDREREREVESIVEEQIKVKSPGRSERHLIVGRGKSIIL